MEHLVGFAKDDLLIPLTLEDQEWSEGMSRLNARAVAWCAEVNLNRGGRIVVVEAVEAQFPGVPGLKSLDRLRRRRNQAEYPDPAGYDPVTRDEADEAIAVAGSAVDSSRRLIERREIGLFR